MQLLRGVKLGEVRHDGLHVGDGLLERLEAQHLRLLHLGGQPAPLVICTIIKLENFNKTFTISTLFSGF
jgi:hypothetical protein